MESVYDRSPPLGVKPGTKGNSTLVPCGSDFPRVDSPPGLRIEVHLSPPSHPNAKTRCRMKTPASLLHRLRTTPDPASWSRLVQIYLPFVCYWGRRSGLQEADVADLAQEVFTLLYQKLPDFTYDQQKSFRNWLRTVTLNKLRELRRRRTTPAGNDALLANLPGPDGEAVWDEEHARYVATRALQLMRTDFDAASWQACWETIVEDRPAAEVAEQLGLTVGAVYAAKSRILRRLRRELDGML